MAQTNVQAFTGDVEIAGSLTIVGGVDKVTLASDSTNTNRPVIFTTGTANAQPLKTDEGLVYNPSTNKLTVSGGLSQSVSVGSYLLGDAYNGATARTFDVDATTAATASKVVARDTAADIFARLFRSNYANQTTISGGMAFRVNNSTDSYIRFCNDIPAIRTFLNVPTREGGNASGTWAINISGIAASSTDVQVDRYDTGDTAMYLTMASDDTAGKKRLYMDTNLVYDNTNNRLKLNSLEITDYIYHSGDTDTYFGFDAADHFRIVEGGGTRFQVDSNGRIGIGGKIDPEYELDVTGSIRATGNVIAFSDRRAKSNIEKIENSLEKIDKISGYTYTMRVKDKDQRFTGLIAQEVLEILPEAVMGSEENYYSLAYGNMVGLLVEGIKEMNEQLQAEKKKVTNLEALVLALNTQVQKL